MRVKRFCWLGMSDRILKFIFLAVCSHWRFINWSNRIKTNVWGKSMCQHYEDALVLEDIGVREEH